MKLPPDHVPGVGVVKSTAYGGVGQRMLEKMGWSVGEGLGKNRDGRRDAIRPAEKRDTHGLGLKHGVDWDSAQWTRLYESSLQQLPTVGAGSDPSSSSSEGEVQDENPDGTESTAVKQELRIYARLARQSRLGRWSSRNGKLHRIKKQETALLKRKSASTKKCDRVKKRKKKE